MANLPVINAAGSAIYVKTSGAGTDGDPHIPSHIVDSIAAALPAGTNNIGDIDVLTVVGDSADLDSGVGADNHALVAVGLPASGGHVIGGTGANPFRVDPTASTVQPVSVASFYLTLDVVASIPNVPSVAVASFNVGVVGSMNVGNFPAVQPVSIASWYIGGNVVASTIGTIFAVVNTAAAGTQDCFVGGSVNVVGNVLASIPNVAQVAVASWFPGAGVVASVVGNPAVIASIAGVPSVLASLPNVAAVAVASFLPHVRPFTIGSQFSAIAHITASDNNVAAISAKGAGVYNYITGISVINAAASYGGAINLQDGTGTLFIGYAPPGGGFVRNFPAGLKPAANATVFLGVPVYSLDLYITVDGFQGS